jgi:hypothetical protein
MEIGFVKTLLFCNYIYRCIVKTCDMLKVKNSVVKCVSVSVSVLCAVSLGCAGYQSCAVRVH